MSERIDLSRIPIFDHHGHPLASREDTSDPLDFARWFTESRDPEIHEKHVSNTILYRTAIGWLAELLNCSPTIESVLEARAGINYEAWIKHLFEQANIEALLCDYGFGSESAFNHEKMSKVLPCEVMPILRLETLAEKLILEHERFEPMAAEFRKEVNQARVNGFVAFKSIAAYRTGLAIESPRRYEAANAFALTKLSAEMEGRVRLASRPLGDYLLWIALEAASSQQLPFQFHTGFGDSDADLYGSNPLLLRPVIEQTDTQIVLLHAGWPYYRESAHLASIYKNVWLDLSLAIPFATTGIPAMVRDIMGMAPLSKVLFATDAFTMPEIYWLAAKWGRWGISRALDKLVTDGFLDERGAYEVAAMILNGNAKVLY